MRYLAGVILVLTCIMAPARASTVPRVDFNKAQTALSLGLFRVGVDRTLSDTLSLGVLCGTRLDLFAGRSVYRLGTTGSGQSYGISLTGGVPIGLQQASWFKPAINLETPLGHNWRFRAEIGPVIRNRTEGWQIEGPEGAVWPAINLEFAYRLTSNSEITLLGDNLIGWRGIF